MNEKGNREFGENPKQKPVYMQDDFQDTQEIQKQKLSKIQ